MKNLIILTFSLGLLLTIGSCNSNSNINSATLSDAETTKAYELMSTKCFACHGPDAALDNRMGPPMIAIKKHYISNETTLEDFKNAMLAFVDSPSEILSKMPGAVKKFGLMPKMSFPKEEIELIAQYIYEQDIEEPEWFQKHYEEAHLNNGNSPVEETELTPKEKGLELALSTKKILGKNLMGAINAKGSEYAVSFCNLKGVSLIDSMANELNASIKRVTDKPRNPEAIANEREAEIIENYKQALATGDEIVSVMDEYGTKNIGYYPITTNQMCMQCHGATSTIEHKTLAKINKLYPQDKATGYGLNELRGIWVVEMAK
jgi:mono/diheme cytochrome c family protein